MAAAGPKHRVLREVELLARLHTNTAIDTLAEIAGTKLGYDDVPAAARVSAANALLDRGWGKPQQSVVIDEGSHHMSDEDLARHVETRIAELVTGIASRSQSGSETGRDDPGNAETQGPGQPPRLVH